MIEPELAPLEMYFRQGSYEEGLHFLDGLPRTDDPSKQSERRRARGWLALALGQTEQAYRLFWSCAHQPGGRAGLLILTILAGQVEAGVGNWQKYFKSQSEPLLTLPDSGWHARPVVLATVGLLERYPFTKKPALRAAASLYRALLYRAVNQPADAFLALACAAEFSPAAALVRDRWLDEIACLPPPSETSSGPAADSLSSSKSTLGRVEDALDTAYRLLLYPDLEKLRAQANSALDRADWSGALEMLRRCLLLEPEDTQSLERRWRLLLKLQEPDAALGDLSALVEIYERRKEITACRRSAERMVETFPDSERALLQMCFLQARLGAPLDLARYGRRLLELCRTQQQPDRLASYRRWLLRQGLTPDDRAEFEVR